MANSDPRAEQFRALDEARMRRELESARFALNLCDPNFAVLREEERTLAVVQQVMRSRAALATSPELRAFMAEGMH